MKTSHSSPLLNQTRNPFALERNLIVPLLLLGTLLLGVVFHCGYHYLHDLTFLKEHLPWSFALFVAPHYTAQLYVASYSGVITTLSLKGRNLTTVNTTEGCGGSPSWLTRHSRSVLFCLDEGLKSDVGGLSAFEIGDDGSLEKLDGMTTEFGPVSAVAFGDKDGGLALAHYGGSAFSTWDITGPNFVAPIQAFNYTLSQPGPNPARQEAPHPHQAVLDPTRRFILVPDLGADLVRIYRVDNVERTVEDHEPLVVAPGSGPRHLAFAVLEETTFMYLVTELGNTVVGYEVSYGGDSVMFEEIWSSGIHGPDKEVPEGAQASEVVVSPDASFVIISSRNDNSSSKPKVDMMSRTPTPSDPLINFAIDAKTGHLNLVQEVACGGRGPRQFSMNKAATLVAVGLQNDGRVEIIARDVKTGLLGEVVAWADVAGEVTAVIFNEDEDES